MSASIAADIAAGTAVEEPVEQIATEGKTTETTIAKPAKIHVPAGLEAFLGAEDDLSDLHDGRAPKRKRGPKKKTASEKSSAELQKEADMADVWNYMMANPTHIAGIKCGMKDGLFDPLKAAKKKEEAAEWFPLSYQKLIKVPEYWLIAMITIACVYFTEELIYALKVNEPDIVWQIVEFAFGLNRHWSWADFLHEKRVLDRTFAALHVLCGSRLSKEWFDDYVDQTAMKILWDEGGVYRKICSDAISPSMVTKMKHITVPGAVYEVSDAFRFDKSVPTDKNWSDMSGCTTQTGGPWKPIWVNTIVELKAMKSTYTLTNLVKFGEKVKTKLHADVSVAKEQLAHHSAPNNEKKAAPKPKAGPPALPPPPMNMAIA
jgi:hypothetical protein